MPLIVTVNKCQKPIIWIDTSIIFNITLFRHGKKQDKIQQERSEFLYSAIKKATAAGRIICPLANQDEEIWIERSECLSTIHELSLGIQTDAVLAIKYKLFRVFAKAFLLREDKVSLDYSIVFDEDPVEELGHVLDSPFHVVINPPLIGGPEQTKLIKKRLHEHLERIRKENVRDGVSFEAQKELEFMAEYDVIKAALTAPNEFQKLGFDGQDYFWNVFESINILGVWSEIVSRYGKNGASIIDFYKSDYYREIPNIKIQTEFFSRLMTDKQPIRSGDMKDIEHISSMVPFVDVFITDKQRKVQLNKLKYNSIYNTRIYYSGDVQELEEFFSSLYSTRDDE